MYDLTTALHGSNVYVSAASTKLQADELLAELFSSCEAFGGSVLYDDGHGLTVEPYWSDGNQARQCVQCSADSGGDGYLLRFRQDYGETQCFFVTWTNANKVF